MIDHLDPFTRGYLEAMFFTNCGEPGDEIPMGFGVEDIAPCALETVKRDCQNFQLTNVAALHEAYDHGSREGAYTPERAGNDFWFTRNGHGTGYWDRGLGDAGEVLTDACGFRTAFPEVWPYVGDDGRIYMS